MSTSGGWEKLKRTNKGAEYIVTTGDIFDSLIDAINAFAQMEISPKSNAATFVMNRGIATLDLSSLDSRIIGIEQALGIVSGNPINSLSNQVANLTYRLDHASATANCVANSVVITFSI